MSSVKVYVNIPLWDYCKKMKDILSELNASFEALEKTMNKTAKLWSDFNYQLEDEISPEGVDEFPIDELDEWDDVEDFCIND